MKVRILLTTACLLAAGAALAQTSATPNVDQRQARQQQRIDQGVASGQLTAKETQKLETQQGRIAQSEAKAKADGVVTKKERKHLHQQQDKASHNIHKQKHDAQVRHAKKPG